MRVWVVLLVWLVATRLLLRQLSHMCHKSRRLLIWLLYRNHLLPHAVLQQKDDTANNAVVTFCAKPVIACLGHQLSVSLWRARFNYRVVHVAFMVSEVPLG